MTEPDAPEIDLSVQELIYAGLEALEAAVALDLCAYLHVSGDFGPQLFLSAPALSSLDPAQAFELFCALRDALDWAALQAEDVGERVVDLAGFSAVTVATTGSGSRGLHAVGRRGRPLMDQERAVTGRLARALGTACHRLEAAAAAAGGSSRVEPDAHRPQH